MGKSNLNPNVIPQTPSWPRRAWAWLTVRNCGGCGACCSTCGHPPFSNEEIRCNKERPSDPLGVSIPIMPLLLWNKVWAEVNAITSDMGLSRCAARLPCAQWDAKTRRCAIHQYRPWACRAYRIRCTDCLASRKKAHRTWRTWLAQMAFALGR